MGSGEHESVSLLAQVERDIRPLETALDTILALAFGA